MKTIAIIVILSASVSAQGFVGAGVTSSRVAGTGAGGSYVEAAATLIKLPKAAITGYGIIFAEPIGSGARLGLRIEVRAYPFVGALPLKPFVGGGVTALKFDRLAYWPVVTTGFDWKGFAPRISYLADSGNGDGYRVGADYLKPISKRWAIRVTVDRAKIENRPAVLVASGGIAWLF